MLPLIVPLAVSQTAISENLPQSNPNNSSIVILDDEEDGSEPKSVSEDSKAEEDKIASPQKLGIVFLL